MNAEKKLYCPIKKLYYSPVKRLKGKRSSIKIGNRTSNYDIFMSKKEQYLTRTKSLELMLNEKVTKIPENIEFISEYLISRVRYWHYGDYIFVNAGTGTGKTTFIEQLAIKGNFNILILTNRTANRLQIKNHLKLNKNHYPRSTVDVISYQTLENEMNLTSQFLDMYDFVVLDEVHYFLSDADFNPKTNLSFEKIIHSHNSIKICMSATITQILLYFARKLGDYYKNDLLAIQKIKIYELKRSSLIINNIIEFNDFSKDLIPQILNDEDKWLIFVDKKEKGQEIYHQLIKKLGDDVVYIDREAVDTGIKIQKSTFRDLVDDEIFYQRVLITTKLLDNGINIRSKKLKKIVCFENNPIELIQMIGRKRPIDKNDAVTIFVNRLSKQMLAGQKFKISKNIDCYKNVKNSLEIEKRHPLYHFDNSKEGNEYRTLSYFNYYDCSVFPYYLNYLGYQKQYIDIENINKMITSNNSFDTKIQWIKDSVGENFNGKIISYEKISVVKIVSDLKDLIDLKFPYATKKEKKDFNKKISMIYWKYFPKKTGERADRPLNIEKLEANFMLHCIPVKFEIADNNIMIKMTNNVYNYKDICKEEVLI